MKDYITDDAIVPETTPTKDKKHQERKQHILKHDVRTPYNPILQLLNHYVNAEW